MSLSEFIDLCLKVLGPVAAISIGVLGWFIRSLISDKKDHSKSHEKAAAESSLKHEAIYDRIREIQKESEDKYMTKEAYALSQDRVEDHLTYLRESQERSEKRADERSDELMTCVQGNLEKLSNITFDHERRITATETQIS